MSALALSTWISQGGLGGGLGSDNTGTSVTLDRYAAVRFKMGFGTDDLESRHTAYLLLFVTAAALLLSTSYLIIARTFTTLIVHISVILSILLNVCVSPSVL